MKTIAKRLKVYIPVNNLTTSLRTLFTLCWISFRVQKLTLRSPRISHRLAAVNVRHSQTTDNNKSASIARYLWANSAQKSANGGRGCRRASRGRKCWSNFRSILASHQSHSVTPQPRTVRSAKPQQLTDWLPAGWLVSATWNAVRQNSIFNRTGCVVRGLNRTLRPWVRITITFHFCFKKILNKKPTTRWD